MSVSKIQAAVLITEVMYNPPPGSLYQYVEVHNNGAAGADIGNWSFVDGLTFTFPGGTILPAGGYLVVCKSKASLQAAYPGLSPSLLVGDFAGALDNDGERVTLADSTGALVQSFRYDDDPPWEFLADGFGASLELLCASASLADAANWRAGPISADPNAYAGSPGAPSAVQTCPPESPSRPLVFISEIMYHPVLEESLEDDHEFIEIYNAEAAPVDLSGWRLSGVNYTFPPQASIGAGEYKVIAKNKAKLAAVASYGLTASQLFGDYPLTLDNGGEKIALIGANGQGVDSVSYDDDFPWPLAADALGAGDDWLKPALLPLANHRYKGYSLERVTFDLPSGEVSNWTLSPLDGATPGKDNASGRAVPLAIAADIDVLPVGGPGPLIRSSNEVQITVRFSPPGQVSAVDLQYFIDDVSSTSEAITTATLFDDGASGGDALAGDGVYSAIAPKRPDNSIVRYRIRGNRGAGIEIISPRSTDPLDWHAYFVSPTINTTTRLYQLFISPANWGAMWNNIQGGRVSGCSVRAGWDAIVPAVFIHEGKVIDARVRYQGSRYNRSNGRALSSWPFPGPSAGPNPPLALSWRIELPRYAPLEGRSEIILNKNNQGCPGYDAGVGYRLYAQADIPAPTTRYIRFHINGGYYHYAIEYERPGEEMLERYHKEQALKYPDRPREKVGHFFKSQGCNCDEGPWGWGDERQLFASCGFTEAQRYQYTYDRKTHSWDTHDEFIQMIRNLHAARAAGTQALRDYFAGTFDLELLLNYYAIMNWSVPFDDMFQNHFLYQRLSDGKWILTPWDLDLNWGGWKGAGASMYVGEQGDPDNRSGWWNYLKDAFLKSYRGEFEQRLLELNNTILHPDTIDLLIDQVTAEANPAEAATAPSGAACSFSGRASSWRSFTTTRHTLVNDTLSSVTVNAGSDQSVFAGSIVQFDARASRPDPGPGVTYSWSNGMSGDFPARLFDTPGSYAITLTMTVNGVTYQDSVAITVLSPPDEAFLEQAGQVVLEAEHFHLNDRHGAAAAWWEADTAKAGYSGDGTMHARDSSYQKYISNYASVAPELRYFIQFSQTGSYRVWIRALSGHTDYDSCHVNLDGVERDESFAQRFNVDVANFLWSGDSRGQGQQTVNVAAAGVHSLSIWIRESGLIVDKIILTRDTAFTPTGAGPAESPTVPLSGHPAFVRGDANRDGGLDLADAVAILRYLFKGSSALSCADHGDVDDNGALQITDAIGLLLYLLKDGLAPEAPFPAAGHDPTTADSNDCGD